MAKADQLIADNRANMSESIARADRPSAATAPRVSSVPPRYQGVNRLTSAFTIEVDQIVADPDQPRKEMDRAKIEDMAQSLRERGQIMPISVRWADGLGKWIIVAGERRWRGAMLAGLKTMHAVERMGPDDPGSILVDQLVENIQREDLSAIDKAHSFRRLMELQGWSGNRLATELRISQSSVAETLALLKIPEAIQDQVRLESIVAATAYELSRIDDPEVQADVARQVVAEKLTRSQTKERIARATKGRAGGVKSKSRLKTAAVFSGSGYKLRVENRKGIDPATLRAVLLQWAETLDTAEAA